MRLVDTLIGFGNAVRVAERNNRQIKPYLDKNIPPR